MAIIGFNLYSVRYLLVPNNVLECGGFVSPYRLSFEGIFRSAISGLVFREQSHMSHWLIDSCVKTMTRSARFIEREIKTKKCKT